MWFALFTIILFSVNFISIRNCSKSNNEDGVLFIPLITMIFWCYYMMQYLEYVEEISLKESWRICACMLANMLIPCSYLYMCKRCHIRLLSASTIGMSALIIFNLFPLAYIYLDHIPAKTVTDGPGLHFIRHAKELFIIASYEFVEFLQAIWVFVRTTILYRKMKESKLHGTKNTRLTMSAFSVALAILTLGTFTPNWLYTNSLFLFFYFSTHLCIACFCLYLSSIGYTDKLIVDENKDYAYIDQKPTNSSLKEKMERLMLKEHLYKDNSISVELVSKKLNTNRTYLARMMRDEFGTTFVNYINTLRVEEAKRLIRENKNERLEDIALMCGFASASTFTKTFKAITGVTPHMWRG